MAARCRGHAVKDAIDAVGEDSLWRKKADDEVGLAGKVEEVTRMDDDAIPLDERDDEILL
jgi:hypothetical protein